MGSSESRAGQYRDLRKRHSVPPRRQEERPAECELRRPEPNREARVYRWHCSPGSRSRDLQPPRLRPLCAVRRPSEQSTAPLGACVLNGCTQDLLDQSFRSHLGRNFFADFQRRRESELFGSGCRERSDLKICRTHSLYVAVPKATPSARERHAKCFCKPYVQSCAVVLSQSTHRMSPRPVNPAPFSTLAMLTLP
jgi:hypothetical protein